MQELEVKNVIIGKQFEDSENLQKFLKIVNDKNIKVNVVEIGDRINVENKLYFDILWPSNNKVLENALNNNSIVCRLNYYSFSMLFTGDIEEIAEEKILEKVNDELLRADILKVAHHGSKTSSIEKFVKSVKCKIAVIGVGKNNKFGHPNVEVLNRLKKYGSKIYRTDEDGEIKIEVDKKRKDKN